MLNGQMQKRLAIEIVISRLLLFALIIQIHLVHFYELKQLPVLDKSVQHQVYLSHVVLREHRSG